jgi:hypothetical protein
MVSKTLLTLSIEELIGRLKVVEERRDLGGGGTSTARLNLTQDELVSWVVSQLQLSG